MCCVLYRLFMWRIKKKLKITITILRGERVGGGGRVRTSVNSAHDSFIIYFRYHFHLQLCLYTWYIIYYCMCVGNTSIHTYNGRISCRMDLRVKFSKVRALVFNRQTIILTLTFKLDRMNMTVFNLIFFLSHCLRQTEDFPPWMPVSIICHYINLNGLVVRRWKWFKRTTETRTRPTPT